MILDEFFTSYKNEIEISSLKDWLPSCSKSTNFWDIGSSTYKFMGWNYSYRMSMIFNNENKNTFCLKYVYSRVVVNDTRFNFNPFELNRYVLFSKPQFTYIWAGIRCPGISVTSKNAWCPGISCWAKPVITLPQSMFG